VHIAIDAEQSAVDKSGGKSDHFLKATSGRYGHHDHTFKKNFVALYGLIPTIMSLGGQ
jgi:hypothetical protein